MLLLLIALPECCIGADFFAILDQEQAVLATDLLSRNEVVLGPAQSTLKSKVDEQAKFIGVATGDQNMNRATWRAVAPLLEAQTNAFRVELARQTVSIEPLLEEEAARRKRKKAMTYGRASSIRGSSPCTSRGLFPTWQ